MKWKTIKKTPEQKRQFQAAESIRLSNWHQWFAWYPVVLTGTTDTIWLSTIYRKASRWTGLHPAIPVWQYSETVFDLLREDPAPAVFPVGQSSQPNRHGQVTGKVKYKLAPP